MTSYLASKLPAYLSRLQLSYQNSGVILLSDLIASSHYVVIENTFRDNWAGGIDGHDVIFFLPIEVLSRVAIDKIGETADRLKEDLNKLAQGIENELFNAVRLDMNDDNDPDFQRTVPFSNRLPINPDTLTFWKPGLARVFISHRDQHKVSARNLSEALEEYGISCFVAHDTIQPLT